MRQSRWEAGAGISAGSQHAGKHEQGFCIMTGRMQMKARMSCHFIAAKKIILTIPNAGCTHLFTLLMGLQVDIMTFKRVWDFLLKVTTHLVYNPAVPLLEVFLRD